MVHRVEYSWFEILFEKLNEWAAENWVSIHLFYIEWNSFCRAYILNISYVSIVANKTYNMHELILENVSKCY